MAPTSSLTFPNRNHLADQVPDFMGILNFNPAVSPISINVTSISRGKEALQEASGIIKLNIIRQFYIETCCLDHDMNIVGIIFTDID